MYMTNNNLLILGVETVSCRLLQQMAIMDMDLKKLERSWPNKITAMPGLQKSLKMIMVSVP